MFKAWSFPFVRYGIILFLIVLISAFLLPGMRMGGFSPNTFLPHATCYLQDTRLIWLHAVTDSLIALAYFVISAVLGFLVYRARRDIPFHWVLLAFGLFIVTCGLTHVMAVINIWKPLYWLAGDVKVVTATASLATAVALPLLVPRIFSVIHSAKLSEQRQREVHAANEELRKLYEKVKEVDELKSQFFANVSHELRTPLSLIIGLVHKLGASTYSGQTDDLEAIRRNSQLLLNQVNDLLEVSRFEAGKAGVAYKVLDLGRIARLACSHFGTLAEDRGLTFRNDIPEGLMIEADREKLERIFLNLLGNAFKFVPKGGSITCSVLRDEENARIVVVDDGPGIPAGMREAVFERFRQVEGGATRRFGGTGLGLSIVKDFVELHGGSVKATETPGGGATFTVVLPLRAPAGTEVMEPSEEDIPGLQYPVTEVVARTGTPDKDTDDNRLPVKINPDLPVVLVVEDDPELNRFISELLSRRYNIICAYNGREGLDRAREVEPDVILSDIMMPGMSGDQLVAAVRSEGVLSKVPIILLSAKADEELRLQLLREGANDFIFKPFKPEELEARVANFVSMARVRKILEDELEMRGRDLEDLAAEALRRKQEAESALHAQSEAEEALRRLNTELEKRVDQRTKELNELNRELQSFTSTVSHDLRAPLRTIYGMAGILLEDYASELDETAQDYARRVVHGAKRMDKLISDLLEYSRVGRQEIELNPVDLAPAIAEAKEGLESEIQANGGIVSIEETTAKVIANHTLLEQVISNLLGNAIKYVPPGVTPEVHVRVKEKGDRVRLEVEDNGIGIAPELQGRIFGIFQRLHSDADYPGTGLGLAILAKAVHRMGGDFGVESATGKGSCFWVELRSADEIA